LFQRRPRAGAVRAAPVVCAPDELFRWARSGGVLDIVKRAKALVLSPASEWRAIERESGDFGYLFANYAAILAAIPPLCEFVGRGFFRWRGDRLGLHHPHHFGFFSGLFGAAVHWLAALAFTYAFAVIVDALAPTFSGRKSRENAIKLAVYSMTPVWLAGVFALIPALQILRLAASLYAVYVFWLGLPVLMAAPSDRIGPYAVASVLGGILLWFVVAASVGPFL